MHVTVDLATSNVALTEPGDCQRFDVVVTGTADNDALDKVLIGAGVGRSEGDEVLMDVDAVRRLASGAVGPSWEADFAAMLEFARGKSWLTDDGQAIRAHVEWR